jgi:hypothetical protein
MNRRLLVLVGPLSVLGFCLMCRAQTPLATIERAIQEEAQIKVKSATLVWEKAGMQDSYAIQEELPDRMHMVRKYGGHTLEVFGVKNTTYWRWDNSHWNQNPMAKSALNIESFASFLLQGMSNVKESAGPTKSGAHTRLFSAHMKWSNRGTLHQGTLRISLDALSLRPLELSFAGTCGTQACSFAQTFNYNPTIMIVPPSN